MGRGKRARAREQTVGRLILCQGEPTHVVGEANVSSVPVCGRGRPGFFAGPWRVYFKLKYGGC